MKHSDERVGLGLEKMTRSFMQFPFAELSTGEWIGEDLLFSSSSTLSYTARTKSAVTVLEFSVADLKKLLSKN